MGSMSLGRPIRELSVSPKKIGELLPTTVLPATRRCSSRTARNSAPVPSPSLSSVGTPMAPEPAFTLPALHFCNPIPSFKSQNMNGVERVGICLQNRSQPIVQDLACLEVG
eukprot:2064473-Pyramimonas_sp.AAC.1